jgi:hypothetical protein
VYSNFKTASGSIRFSSPDSNSKANAFLKVNKTSMVKLWSRNANGSYIDSTATDADSATHAEVGLFIDSLSSTHKNYAALVVNTRLYPSLRDADDSGYYNKGFEGSGNQPQRCRSIYGDIDTRKIWMTIDTTMLSPVSRANYYVVHDLWHPDTSWLVKCDSMFAVYIKPGDAKFLYFEKGIAIHAADTAATTQVDFGFNNGRRVAERMNGSRDVAVYTKKGKLYVSDPSRGWTIPGYPEHSYGDNIATGHEVLLDADTGCYHPSICVGRNDTSVAIVYWKAADQGIHAAYQAHPDSAWKFAQNFLYVCKDTTPYNSAVTPVLTPINDTLWLVAAAFHGYQDGVHPPGIIGARFRYEKETSRQIVFISDPFTYLFRDQFTDSNDYKRSQFPTVTSRPLVDSLWPLRLAWQKAGQIFYRRIIWSNDTLLPLLENPKNISLGLPNFCYNYHPSIGMCGISDRWRRFRVAPLETINDYVTWESKVFPLLNPFPSAFYYPILRYAYQTNNTVGQTWSRTFQEFDGGSNTDHVLYPVVSVNNRIGGKVFNNSVTKQSPPYHDFLRLAWENPVDLGPHEIDLAHWENGWIHARLQEAGLMPSLGQTTDTIRHWTDSNTVPPSIVFVGDQTSDGGVTNRVRVTNGWAPWIDFITPVDNKMVVLIDSTPIHGCNAVVPMKIMPQTVTINPYGGGPSTTMGWLPVDITLNGVLGEDWPTSPSNPEEIITDVFPLNGGDTIRAYRVDSILNLTTIRNSLAGYSDTLSVDFVLRNAKTGALISTIEHSYITKTAILAPGYGLDTVKAYYVYPVASPFYDSVIVSCEVKRAQLDSLTNYMVEYENSDTLPPPSYKKTPENQPATAIQPAAKVTIVPYTLSFTASVVIILPDETLTTVELYDNLGKKVQSLYSNTASGELHLTLDGSELSTGMYFLRVRYGNTVITRKVELVK